MNLGDFWGYISTNITISQSAANSCILGVMQHTEEWEDHHKMYDHLFPYIFWLVDFLTLWDGILTPLACHNTLQCELLSFVTLLLAEYVIASLLQSIAIFMQ